MSPWVLRLALLLPSVILGLATGCSGHDVASAGLSQPPARASCESEARQLTESADLYSAPNARAEPVGTLAPGRFVYRCEERGDWLGVMYPAIGEKVDCAERQSDLACNVGWIRNDRQMAIFG